ncbi:MAG TPA: AAA-like domain-containing protein [Chthonomonadaceae bacterium]|nr:AAA-like domain-containing protein [Chthonomonadaceae bacterium]
MTEKPRSAQIAHVLFLDIVGYSRLSTGSQGQTMERLNAVVNASPAFSRATESGALPLPTGDGMALLFFHDVITPAQCAMEVTHALRGEAAMPLRMGIHSGLVQKQMDIAGRENVVGEGINTAQRVMDFGDAGHILLSAQYAIWLQQFEEWLPRIHPLGDGTAKHNLKISLYSLHGKDFGNSKIPSRFKAQSEEAAPAKGSAVSRPPVSAMTPQKVVLLYKRNVQPDENVLKILEEQLRASGHEVFVDHHVKIGVVWAEAIEERIRAADAVIAIVSPKAMQSEMLEFEIETAHDQQSKTGKPAILPVMIGEEKVEDGVIAALIKPLNTFVWTSVTDDQKLVVELLSAIQEPLKPRVEEIKLEPVGGAVPPDSPFYIRRATDQEFSQALQDRESILLVKGARQMGKTSLLAQGTRQARNAGWRCGMTDFQKLNSAQMASEEVFYKLLAATLARQLKFKYDFDNEWDDIFGANLNMETFLRELLDAEEEPLVWFMDEVDKLFLAPFASDFFGLVRSWHNSRSTEPDGPWGKLTVVISYATEAHLFIQDLNQSPFNVGRKLELEDFNLQQTVDLNGRYGSPLKSYQEVEQLHVLVAGQPFLTRKALDALATGKYDFANLLAEADRDDGPFNDHLKRILVSVSRLPAVMENVQLLLKGQAMTSRDAYYRLLASGVIKQGREGQANFRCELYARYLRGHLS